MTSFRIKKNGQLVNKNLRSAFMQPNMPDGYAPGGYALGMNPANPNNIQINWNNGNNNIIG